MSPREYEYPTVKRFDMGFGFFQTYLLTIPRRPDQRVKESAEMSAALGATGNWGTMIDVGATNITYLMNTVGIRKYHAARTKALPYNKLPIPSKWDAEKRFFEQVEKRLDYLDPCTLQAIRGEVDCEQAPTFTLDMEYTITVSDVWADGGSVDDAVEHVHHIIKEFYECYNCGCDLRLGRHNIQRDVDVFHCEPIF